MEVGEEIEEEDLMKGRKTMFLCMAGEYLKTKGRPTKRSAARSRSSCRMASTGLGRGKGVARRRGGKRRGRRRQIERTST